MILKRAASEHGEIIFRLSRNEDIPAIINVYTAAYPALAKHGILWSSDQLASHQKVFPDGQMVAECDGAIIGCVASLIVFMGTDPYRQHTYSGITDGGFFHNHDPQGDTLYGADIFIHPDYRGCGIARTFYQLRKELCTKLNLRRILAGGRIPGYAEVAEDMRPEEYVTKVENGQLSDPVLNFQLHMGFVVRGILHRYLRDSKSQDYATLVEWLNPDYEPGGGARTKVRVSCVQYQVRQVRDFDDFAQQVEYFVETAADYRSDFVVFPEFFSVQLLSQPSLRKKPSLEGISQLADLEKPFMDLMCSLAKDYGLHIIAGSHPIRRGNVLLNASPLIYPDGSFDLQPKLHITPSERRYWGISGGDRLTVFPTAKAKVGILICYDSEFPEAARYLADRGAEIIFVPYCTDDRQAYLRVRYCSQARAVENQVYVVTSGIIGNLPSVPAMDIHYGRAGVFSPSDFEFARDGIQAQADSNVEMLLVSDLDISDLHRSRASGSVRPRHDRRSDLFEFKVTFEG
jgi:predicted amidohydrolase/GNAT superfamily N-acetyltransferase